MERLIHLQIQEISTGDSGDKKEEETTKNRKDSLKGKKGRQHVIICKIFTSFSISSPITLDNQDVYFDNLSTIASFVPLYDLYLTLLFTITILIENFSVLAFLRYDQSNGRVLWQMSRIFINTARKRGCLYAARTVINLTDPIVVSKHYSFGISPILWRRHCKGTLRKLLTL